MRANPFAFMFATRSISAGGATGVQNFTADRHSTKLGFTVNVPANGIGVSTNFVGWGIPL
jgi:hypothetical protein